MKSFDRFDLVMMVSFVMLLSLFAKHGPMNAINGALAVWAGYVLRGYLDLKDDTKDP